MANRTVALLLRVELGVMCPHLKPATSENGRVRPGYGIVNGVRIHFADATYYIRNNENRKLKIINVGDNLYVALVELRKPANLLDAKIVGNVVADSSEKAPARAGRYDRTLLCRNRGSEEQESGG
jgi:hypothetical protein